MGLTATEKNEVKKLMSAYSYLVDGIDGTGGLGKLFDTHTDDNTTATSLALVGSRYATLWSHLDFALFYLLGANPYEPGSANYTTLEAQSRSTWVTNAWTSISAAATAKTNLDTAIDAAKANVDATGDGILENVVKSKSSSAASSIADVSQSETYTNARSETRLVGPHGTYTTAVNRIARALVLLNSSFVSLMEMYDTGTLGETVWSGNLDNGSDPPEPLAAFRQMTVATFQRVGLNLHQVLFHFAQIPLDITECGYTPFHLIGRTMERLLSEHSESSSLRNLQGNPYSYVVAFGLWQDGFRSGLGTRPNAHAKFNSWSNNWLLSWTQSDSGAWDPLEFPTDVTLADLRAQGGNVNTANTTPLCNAATNPTITMVYPPDGKTVGGRITVSFSCLDNATVVRGGLKIDGVDTGETLVSANNGITTYFPVGTTDSDTTVQLSSGHSRFGFIVGDTITGTNIPANTTITAINTSTDVITLSAAATGNGSGITFTTTHPIVFSYAWDTTAVSNGSHTLQGIGYDNALNTGTSSVITVTVAN